MEDSPEDPPRGGVTPPGTAPSSPPESSDEGDTFLRDRIPDRVSHWRNKIGFWVLGLCNNLSYVIMLSAAHDILDQQEDGNRTLPVPGPNVSGSVAPPPRVPPPSGGEWNGTGRFDCNNISTAAILLADILPTLGIKLTAPFFIQHLPYGIRVTFCAVSALASFLLVSFSVGMWMSILGVVCASVSSGLGEYTFLALTSYYHVSSVSYWSSGTGAAGLLGALSYSGLTQSGLSPRDTVLLMVIVPIALCCSYCFLLVKPTRLRLRQDPQGQGMLQEEECTPIIAPHPGQGSRGSRLTFREKLTIIKSLLKYMVPLGTVYFAEYFINQGLLELLFFRNIFLDHNAQYRWYQTLYQLGVFLSRSSAECLHLHRIWILAVLQLLNIAFLAANVWTTFVPTIWIIFILILYEGMLGGAAYVNTFRNISNEVPDEHREFAMGAACVADTLGIAVSGAIAVPLHDYLCHLA